MKNIFILFLHDIPSMDDVTCLIESIDLVVMKFRLEMIVEMV